MSDNTPSLHAANCRVEGCEWGTIGFDMPTLYADLGEHLMDVHNYSTDDWMGTLRSLKSDPDT